MYTVFCESRSAARGFYRRGSKATELLGSFLGKDASISTGPPNFSLPVVTANACKRCTNRPRNPPFSLVRARTKSVPVRVSITGVAVMPTSG
jgi:hypothetical protein